MISTYVGYSILARDMQTSLNNVAKQAPVKRETDYYNENIGKVKTVDDLMDNYRLYSYTMKAYGLEDMAYAKAFIRKVLESDLNDPNSFASKLSDPRYQDLAAAFNFGTKTDDAQTSAQEDELIGLYKQFYTDAEQTAKTETTYYSNNIDDVKTVYDFLNNDRLRDYAMEAYGIDTTYVSNNFLASVLTSDVSDPNSFVNVNGNAKYKALAAQFSFNPDGTAKAGGAQTTAQMNAVMEQYNLNVPAAPSPQEAAYVDLHDITVPSFTTRKAAEYNKAYYESHIGSVKSVDDITKDPRLFAYVKTAYSIDPTLSAGEFKVALTSDLSDPGSYANIRGYQAAVKAFNFGTDGKLKPGATVAQTSDAIAQTSTNYMARYDDNQQEVIDDAAKNFADRMSNVKTLDDFFKSNKDDDVILNNDMVEPYVVALQAYGIDVGKYPISTLKKALSSDPYDPKSYVNSLKDDQLTKMVKAFNFDSSGNATTPLMALSETQVNRYVSDYKSRATMLLTSTAEKNKAAKDAKDAATYFQENIGKVKSASDFLADDKLVSFVLQANGIDPKDRHFDDAFLKKIFASDPDDPKSFVNTQDNPRWKDIVEAFNFDKDGNLSRDKIRAGQNTNVQQKTTEMYAQQTLEEEQGQSNEGVRLALYFARKAPDVTSLYDLLGDQALYQVVSTTFSLPSSMSSMDVDQQVAMLGKFISLDDLQDPDKLDKLMKRFTAMYDMKNSAGTSAALTILTGGVA